jgi:hypothetical protein
MPHFAVERAGSGHRAVELPPNPDSEWPDWEFLRLGNVGGPFVEIRGPIQMLVRRWAEAVPSANEDYGAESCYRHCSVAGCSDIRPGRFFSFLSPAARSSFRVVDSKVAPLLQFPKKILYWPILLRPPNLIFALEYFAIGD